MLLVKLLLLLLQVLPLPLSMQWPGLAQALTCSARIAPIAGNNVRSTCDARQMVQSVDQPKAVRRAFGS